MQTKFYLANTYEYLIYQHFDNKNQQINYTVLLLHEMLSGNTKIYVSWIHHNTNISLINATHIHEFSYTNFHLR